MTTKELRIGNYLLYEGDRIQVTNIAAKSINLTFEGITVVSWIPIEEVEPIPLTTQIIERLGFRYRYNTYPYKDSEYRITKANGRFFLTFIQDHKRLVEVFFVHQVQNLIYSLTGEEISFRR